MNSKIEMNKNRNKQFDLTRCFAVLWIVGFTHLATYTSDSLKEVRSVFFIEDITRTMLSVFMFISGYFLSKYTFTDLISIKDFYIKRFYRFYILFIISAVSLFIMGFIPNFSILATTITGLSSYILPQPKTLWFISMLLGFYILTPIIKKLLSFWKNIFIKVLTCFLISIFVFGVSNLCTFDKRLYWCFFFYSIGITMGDTIFYKTLISKKITALVSAILYIIVLMSGLCNYNNYCIGLIIGVIFITSISGQLVKITPNFFIDIVSYSSMCMYLFHRHIYMVEAKIYNILFGENCPVLYAYVIMLPSVIFFSYWIQKLYNNLIVK